MCPSIPARWLSLKPFLLVLPRSFPGSGVTPPSPRPPPEVLIRRCHHPEDLRYLWIIKYIQIQPAGLLDLDQNQASIQQEKATPLTRMCRRMRGERGCPDMAVSCPVVMHSTSSDQVQYLHRGGWTGIDHLDADQSITSPSLKCRSAIFNI